MLLLRKRSVFFTFLQQMAHGNLLGEVSLIQLTWEPNTEPPDVIKMVQIVFSTRFGYLENIFDHPARIMRVDFDSPLFFSLLISFGRPERGAT